MMSITNDQLNQARRNLVEALGDKKDVYFYHMKQWFRMKATKEEFDSRARELLPTNLVHFHNEFLIAILSKCQLLLTSNPSSGVTHIKTEIIRTEETVVERRTEAQPTQVVMPTTISSLPSIDRKKLKPKKKSKQIRPTVENNFEATSLHEIAPNASLQDPSAISDAGSAYYSRTLQMLETGPLKGRALLSAWDHGLASVNDSVAPLLQEASRQLVKNVLTCAISRRKGFRMRESKFIHSLGTIPANPWLRNASSLNDWTAESPGIPFGEGECNPWPTVDAAEQNAAQLASCAPQSDPALPPLSTFDLFTALKIYKSVIPSHSVYSLNMERISSRLWHPGWAELEQEAIAAKETSVKELLREQRLATNPIS